MHGGSAAGAADASVGDLEREKNNSAAILLGAIVIQHRRCRIAAYLRVKK